MQQNELKAGALFAGIGGFCLGFAQSGIKTVWAVENNPAAVQTYQHNISNVRIVMDGDVPASVKDVGVKSHQLEPVDVLHAGFPCQSFSMAGERKGFEDDRGKLFYEIIRIVKEFGDNKPSVIVLENSPHLRNGEGGAWFLEVTKELKNLGYWFRESNSAKLDCYDLTPLPQQRKRLFMVAFSIDHFKNGRLIFPEPIQNPVKNLSDYVAFDSINEDGYYYLNEENRYHKMITDTGGEKNCMYHLRKYLVREKQPNLCPTLTANMGLGGHNVPFIYDKKGVRKLTEFECLKLQGFPETFKFPENLGKNKCYTQVGNSVSVPVAALLAKAIREKIDKERNK